MIKFRMYWDKDKETKWLNEMAAEGWAMKRFFAGIFWFEPCEKGEFTYQIDFGDRCMGISENYREFMWDMGVEIVQTWGFWVILRKPACEGEFQLYTDVDSAIAHYKKIRNMFKAVTILELVCALVELAIGVSDGTIAAYVIACIAFAFALILANAALKTSNIIAELRERKGEEVSDRRNSQISPILPFGLLLNGVGMFLMDTGHDSLKRVVQIAAIVCMAVGIFKTMRNRKGL